MRAKALVSRPFRWSRWVVTGAAVLALGLEAVSYFATGIYFGTQACCIDDEGQVFIRVPEQWAESEYSQESLAQGTPVSLIDILTYCLPDLTQFSVTWRSESGCPWREM